ncbi:MAG: DUF4920 domain-containing protein [Planctomycetes bacterium]|nr:DUF4920 domain-containing protein [Planctomycetota bacterium]
MKKSLPLVLAIALVGCGGAPKASQQQPESQPSSQPMAMMKTDLPAGETRGAGIHLTKVTAFEDVAEHPASYAGRPVLLKAQIADVCKVKGCWMVLTDGEHQMRVKFKDYGFFVPTDCDGHMVYVEGLVSMNTIDVETLKHYAAESGTADPDTITEPQSELVMVATGAHVVAK